MPILKNAKKALRASKKKAMFNQRVRSMLKTAFDQLIEDPSEKNLQITQSKIDIAAKGNIIAKNKASRLKTKASKISKAAGVKLGTNPKKKTVAKKAAKKIIVVKKVAKASTTKKTIKKAAKKS